MSIPLIGVLTLLKYDLLIRLIRSIDFPVDNLVILFQGGHNNNFDFSQIRNHFINKITIVKSSYNIGVARGWNYILQHFAAPYYIISGDDTYFEYGTLRNIYNFMSSGNVLDHVMFDFGMNTHNSNDGCSGFTSYIFTEKTKNVIGYFDENIYPAYVEDNDFWRRIILSGEPHGRVPNTHIFSGDNNVTGSCTINSVSPDYRSKMHQCQQRNHNYYNAKWNNDTSSHPFNRGDISIKDVINHENYHINQSILLGHTNPASFDTKIIYMNELFNFNWQKYLEGRDDFQQHGITTEQKCTTHWVDFYLPSV